MLAKDIVEKDNQITDLSTALITLMHQAPIWDYLTKDNPMAFRRAQKALNDVDAKHMSNLIAHHMRRATGALI